MQIFFFQNSKATSPGIGTQLPVGDSCSTKNLGKGVLLVNVLSGCRSEGQGFLVPGWRELDLEDAAWIWPD